jgi:hypothetical protein
MTRTPTIRADRGRLSRDLRVLEDQLSHELMSDEQRQELRACYEPALSSPAACWRKRQANATK